MSEVVYCRFGSQNQSLNKHGPASRALAPGKRAFARLDKKAPYATAPVPLHSLQAFVDLGLNDAEIARYFAVPRKTVRCQLRALQRGEIGGVTSVPLITPLD